MDSLLEPDHPVAVLHPSVQAHAGTQTWTYAAQLLRLPGFAEAMASYCAAMVEPPGLSWPTDKVFAQKLRYIVSFILIGHHARWLRSGGEPPTLAALQRAAPASARQVATFVGALRLGGYVIASRDAGDRRALHLRPSMALLQEIARSPLAFLEASERLAPGPRSCAGRLRVEANALSGWLGRSSERFHAGDILFAPFPSIVRFTEYDCGYPVLTAVFGAHYAALTATAAPALLSYGALAERFRVSRQHIGNIFIEAERRNWFSVGDRGRVVAISPELVQEFETWAVGQMAHYRLLAEEISPLD